MGKTIARNKDSWNKEVIKYSETLRKDIFSFIDQYKKNEGLFRLANLERQKRGDESIDQVKLRILERRIRSLFPNGGEARSHNN